MTPHIWDTFMLSRELDVLECRLTELECIPNLTHVLVEATVDHQDHVKPLYFAEHADRFAQWKNRIVHVVADSLPTLTEDPNQWARENAQREWVRKGLEEAGAQPDDVVLHGDCDEIPTVLAARNIRPRAGFVSFDMRCFSMAVDWQHPDRWHGTVAARLANVSTFSAMRNARNYAPSVRDAGWHLGWLGGREDRLDKLGSFCHPEISDRTLNGLRGDWFYNEGVHVDLVKLAPVDVDRTWPRWVADRKCPPEWFRPRHRPRFTEDWFSARSCFVLGDLAASTDGLTGDVVEIGSWEGRSTIALADAVYPATVHAVDTWEGSPGEVSADLAAERDVFGRFEENVKLGTKGNVCPHRMGWREYFAQHAGPIRCLFIDAEHTYREVFDNIAAALPLMVPGGIICGDDIHHPPVRQAVLEHFPQAQGAASLWYFRI